MTPRSEAPGTLASPGRLPELDALRGLAIALMVAYHFCFDLTFYGAAHFDFNHDPFWLTARSTIVALFLGVMGASLHLATRSGIRWRHFCRRLALIAGCALLVSLGSYALFPQSYIYFGVLHFIALASLLGLAFRRLFWANLVLGLTIVALGGFSHPVFDQPWLHWVGMMTHKPITEDYVPLVPWFGVVLVGMFLGRLWSERVEAKAERPPVAGIAMLALPGRHSLLIYMVHQPILLGVLYPLVA
jgi:uncharacterized membrane protein